jgi:hypothetical protein
MAKAKQPNRGGRPRKSQIQAGEKTTISVRITPEVRKHLEKAIARNGRSLTQEVELRIERSFWEEYVSAHTTSIYRLIELDILRALRTVLAEGEVSDRRAAVEKLTAEMEETFKGSGLQSLHELEDGKAQSLGELARMVGDDT